jgi:hypothetical protein
MERGEAQIPATNAQATLLQAIQKRHDQRGLNLLKMQSCRWLVQPMLRELQKLTEGITVRADSVGTRLALLHQALREEALQ